MAQDFAPSGPATGQTLTPMIASLGLIGLGGIGRYHLASMRALEQRGRARVAAVVEPMAERFPDLRRDLEAHGVRWYTDYRDMLCTESDLAAVTIATPIHLHLQMTLACLEHGLFVNLEKPPVPLVQQLEALIRADVNSRVTVGFQMIVSRCVQRMKRLIVEGAIGEIHYIRACGCWPRLDRYYQRSNWAGKLTLDGEAVFDGPATNALAHLVHNIMFLGAPDTDGFAVPMEVQGELYRARPIESYDVACLRGRFATGIEFAFAATHATRQTMPFKIEVRGSKGWLCLTDDGANLDTSSGESLRCPETTQQLLDVCHDRYHDIMHGEPRRTYTSLADTRGYVRATNGLWLSSGGIHDLDTEWVEPYQEGHETGYNVRGLYAAVERVFAEGRLFSELNLPWATARPIPVRLDNLQSLVLNANGVLSAA